MLDSLIDLVFIINRYVHIVCTTVIVGGTLFYELIVPIAIGELKPEQQLSVFGRARWSFRGLVWTCAILLVISGVVSSVRQWHDYSVGERIQRDAMEVPTPGKAIVSDLRRPGWWWAAHVSTGLVALAVGVSLMTVRRPPTHPLYWMRLSLIILMVVIFLATTARHMRLALADTERSLAAPRSGE